MDDKSWLDELNKHNEEWAKYAAKMGRHPMLSRKMPCCQSQGVEIWGYTLGAWYCSVCETITSTDPHYKGYDVGIPSEDVLTPKPTDGKCICSIQTLMSTGCKCNGK